MTKRVKVIEETSSGRNEIFKDIGNNLTMTRAQFVKKIEDGKYPDYHIRKINNTKTPVSNPDGSENNNLG